MRSFLTVLLTAVVFLPSAAEATDVEGDVWGTWTRENSPYNVIGEVRVPPGSTLVIEPGVLVDFKGHYKFIVDSLAVFLAIGTETDSIVFTAQDPDSGWHGIRFLHSDGSCQVRYCRIEYGRAAGGLSDKNGGAIFCEFADPIISNNSIAENSAHWGGGICCSRSSAVICNNVFIGNRADSAGGGVACSQSSPRIKANFFERNIADSSGGGIFCWRCSTMTIEYNSFYEDSAYRGGGIHCFGCLDVTISDNVVHRNRAGRGAGIQCNFSDRVTIADNLVSENRTRWSGAGVRFHRATGTIERNIISGNRSYEPQGGQGSGIFLWDSSPLINNNIISDNSSEDAGGAVFCNSSSPVIINNCISGNSAARGGGVLSSQTSHPKLSNNILWGNSAAKGPEICLLMVHSLPCSLTLAYCDVEGGRSGVHVGPNCVLYQGAGNIDSDPLFRDPGGGDFHLMAEYCGDPYNSPCIDAGHPDSLDQVLDCFHGLCSETSDMGAYGGRNSGWPTGVEDDDNILSLPQGFILHQNYPNPFNVTTVIEYQVPVHPSVKLEVFSLGGRKVVSLVDSRQQARYRSVTWDALGLSSGLYFHSVKLEVYNMRGRKVASLVDSKQQAGFRSITWDASRFSSGLYFYRLTAGEFSQTKMMMMVK